MGEFIQIMIPIKAFNEVLQEGIQKCPKDKRYVALHVFSGHMAIYCEYYDDIYKIAEGIAEGILDPQGSVDVKAIYDTIDKELLYYDAIGMAHTVHDEWEKIKDRPKPLPVVPEPQLVKSPREKLDHYCQYNDGEDVCYFCGDKKVAYL